MQIERNHVLLCTEKKSAAHSPHRILASQLLRIKIQKFNRVYSAHTPLQKEEVSNDRIQILILISSQLTEISSTFYLWLA